MAVAGGRGTAPGATALAAGERAPVGGAVFGIGCPAPGGAEASAAGAAGAGSSDGAHAASPMANAQTADERPTANRKVAPAIIPVAGFGFDSPSRR